MTLEQEAATANGIYGLIVGSAVMVSARGQSTLNVVVATVVTLLVYWTAERYAHLMARQMVHAGVDRHELRRELGRGWELVTATFVPLAVLIGSSLLGGSLFTAVLMALMTATALLAAEGWRMGRAAELSRPACVASALCAAGFGAVMVVLKTQLH